VIEIDGPVHLRPEIQSRDRERDQRLRAEGWTVLRLTDQKTVDTEQLFCCVAELLGLDFEAVTLSPVPSP